VSLAVAALNTTIDVRLLELLLEAGVQQTMGSLASQLGMNRDAVTAAIERLRRAGCVLDEHPHHGVGLIEAGLGCWADYLETCGGADARRHVTVYGRTASTQDICRTLLDHPPVGTKSDTAMIVIADEQTAGRGRLGRQWIAPRGMAVTLSQTHAMLHGRAGQTVDRINFAVTVAIARAIESFLDAAYRPVRIKWPNDILVGGRKIAGILVETVDSAQAGQAAIIGVGINVALEPQHLPGNDPQLAKRVTSLVMCGVEVDRLRVAAAAIEQMHAALHLDEPEKLIEQWRQRSIMLHHHVRLKTDGKTVAGQVIDLDPCDGLIVRTTSGTLLHLPAATTTVL
jgi:BirA family biotin operon repressor/biotin-[acetyl-CoA-carboxylase] ligase